MPKKDYIGFAKNFHHKGKEFNYCFDEIVVRMQEHGIVRDNFFGYYIQAPIKIVRGLKIETSRGLVRMIFEKVPKTDGYYVSFKKVKDYPQTSQR